MQPEFNTSTIGFYLAHLILLGLLIISSYTDWKYRKIYNKVTVTCFLAGLLLSVLYDFPGSLGNALLASSVAFAIFFIMFTLGQMGGGDVKLATAIGALTGFPFILNVLLWAIIAGGIYAIAVLLLRGGLWENIKRVCFFVWNLIFWRKVSSLFPRSSDRIPYGLCISAGTLIALFLKYANYPALNSWIINF